MTLFRPRRNRMLIMQHGVVGGSGYVPGTPSRDSPTGMLWESGDAMLWESGDRMMWASGGRGIEYA